MIVTSVALNAAILVRIELLEPRGQLDNLEKNSVEFASTRFIQQFKQAKSQVMRDCHERDFSFLVIVW